MSFFESTWLNGDYQLWEMKPALMCMNVNVYFRIVSNTDIRPLIMNINFATRNCGTIFGLHLTNYASEGGINSINVEFGWSKLFKWRCLHKIKEFHVQTDLVIVHVGIAIFN